MTVRFLKLDQRVPKWYKGDQSLCMHFHRKKMAFAAKWELIDLRERGREVSKCTKQTPGEHAKSVIVHVSQVGLDNSSQVHAKEICNGPKAVKKCKTQSTSLWGRNICEVAVNPQEKERSTSRKVWKINEALLILNMYTWINLRKPPLKCRKNRGHFIRCRRTKPILKATLSFLSIWLLFFSQGLHWVVHNKDLLHILNPLIKPFLLNIEKGICF